ncbi:MAG: AMP-binding protein [Deltaproteobacteria bacterium]|nr:AMP-binding protein [Deltaproteobacteria bacterium]MBW1817652.1 AMP-binding protein [Deltaproteobacteria bacterium]MBW2284414.1 AMP-binding protein [Deltaproteobacteria bacterium]
MTSVYEKRPWTQFYPEWLPRDLEIPDCTALDDFEASAARRGESPAVYYFDWPISYGELDRFASGLAAAFADLGVSKGDRILVDLQNVPQFPAATYAAWKVGAVVVPVNPMYREKELAYFCNDSGAKVLVTLDEIASGLDLSFLADTSVQTTITTSPLDFLPQGEEPPPLLKACKKTAVPGTLDMLELVEKFKGKSVSDPALRPEDVAFLTYTSGTTGPPKGAMNTHGNIAFSARVYQAALRMTDDDVVLGVAPLFHVTGEVAHLAIAALVGIPMVLYYRFDPAESLRLIERWRVTMTVASITVYIALMNHPDIQKWDLSSFMKAYSGGAPVSSAIVDRFKELTGLYIYNVYGMTETNSPSHLVPLGLKAPVDTESGALSVGLPVPNAVIKIMDLEDGDRELPAGEVGEIVDFGPMVVPGYWEKPEETKHAIRDGWMYTGDVGKMDGDGWFYVVDRKKDMIVASGYKVWPRDVEDVIYQHPAVRETAVVGVPDDYRGETVKAFVALREGDGDTTTPKEIIEFCKARMAAYKYPRQVEIVPEIPKTLTGKFLRRTLREKNRSSA